MRVFPRLVVAAGVALALISCARNKELVPTGGSRADGTVHLSFEHGNLEIPKLNMEQGLVAARERCRAWGYTDAEPFGGQQRHCQLPNDYGCARWLVTLTYQCLGANKPT